MRILYFGDAPRKRKSGDRNPFTIGVALFVIIAGGIVLWFTPFPQLSSTRTQYIIKDPFGLSEESLNKIPKQFSANYILGANSTVLQGATIQPTNRGPMYRVVFQTTSAVKDLVAEYKDFFTQANWTVGSEAEASGLIVVAFDRGVERILLSAYTKGSFTEATVMLDPKRQ